MKIRSGFVSNSSSSSFALVGVKLSEEQLDELIALAGSKIPNQGTEEESDLDFYDFFEKEKLGFNDCREYDEGMQIGEPLGIDPESHEGSVADLIKEIKDTEAEAEETLTKFFKKYPIKDADKLLKKMKVCFGVTPQ